MSALGKNLNTLNTLIPSGKNPTTLFPQNLTQSQENWGFVSIFRTQALTLSCQIDLRVSADVMSLQDCK